MSTKQEHEQKCHVGVELIDIIAIEKRRDRRRNSNNNTSNPILDIPPKGKWIVAMPETAVSESENKNHN